MKFWQPNSPLSGLPTSRPAARARSSTWDRTGGNRDFAVVAPRRDPRSSPTSAGRGNRAHLADDALLLGEVPRKLVLEMYWDDHPTPSVRDALGDFFGVGHATCVHYVSLPINMVFGPRRGPKGPFAAAMNCYFPMPFADAARIEMRNE